MVLMGLIPAKLADPDAFKIFTSTNARAESILEKPIWKGPFSHSRCLIPLDGFYEWLQRPSLPQPPPIEPGEHGLFGDIPAPAKRTSFVPLTQYIGFAGLPLSMQGVERLLETFFGRLAGVDSTANRRANLAHFFGSFFLVPKKAGPDQCVPVISQAIGERLLYFLPW
jgi:hypothetical protein